MEERISWTRFPRSCQGWAFTFGSDISNFIVFWFRGVECVRIFLHFGPGLDILSSGSVILDQVRIFKKKIHCLIFYLKYIFLT